MKNWSLSLFKSPIILFADYILKFIPQQYEKYGKIKHLIIEIIEMGMYIKLRL